MSNRSRIAVTAALLLCGAATAAAHDLFLTLGTFFLRPETTARISVVNGTFTKSEGAVSRSRLRDLSVVSGGNRRDLDRELWDAVDSTLSILRVPVGVAGTYVVGASLLPREITLQAGDFNGYLEDEGILPIIERRRERGETDSAARERYAKHVKALLQVGGTRTADFSTALGYPAELVPLDNPYELRGSGTLRVRALVEGQPAPGQVVLSGGRTPSGARIAPRRSIADSAGVASIRLTRGKWYVKFIHMAPVQGDSIDYESKWATLTFEVK